MLFGQTEGTGQTFHSIWCDVAERSDFQCLEGN